jgi:putative membrane protein
MTAIPVLLAEGIMPWPATSLWQALLYTIVFGVLGILLVAFGFKVFDWLLPKVDVEVELAERQNMAVGIVVAAVVLGISAVIIAAMVG